MKEITMPICQKCGIEHDGTFGSGKFCSRSCANSRERSAEVKEKLSKSLKEYYHEEISSRIKPCAVCGKIFTAKRSHITTCSSSCAAKLGTKTKKAKGTFKNPGGYHAGCGSTKQGWYKGIHCNSAWELACLIYFLDQGTQIS